MQNCEICDSVTTATDGYSTVELLNKTEDSQEIQLNVLIKVETFTRQD